MSAVVQKGYTKKNTVLRRFLHKRERTDIMSEPLNRRRLVRERICLVCRRPVAEGMGVRSYYPTFLAHQGECIEKIKAVEKDYSRSRKGRKRSFWEMLALLEANNPCR
jgi:hypothetical protein